LLRDVTSRALLGRSDSIDVLEQAALIRAAREFAARFGLRSDTVRNWEVSGADIWTASTLGSFVKKASRLETGLLISSSARLKKRNASETFELK
jgi:hypothetical protein